MNPWQVDGEDASAAREVAGINPALIRLGAPPAESKTKPQANSVRTVLLEGAKELAEIPAQETAASVFDNKLDTILGGVHAEGHR